ncbi:hypothetical protein [Paraburkholderia sp.]|uniref:hypothetical protein n=1 Tax=Paraburkholderia sp. TaxID=1926495 RepID=UPI003D6F9342
MRSITWIEVLGSGFFSLMGIDQLTCQAAGKLIVSRMVKKANAVRDSIQIRAARAEARAALVPTIKQRIIGNAILEETSCESDCSSRA